MGGDEDRRQAEWDAEARHETRAEQLDRNLVELVQELRVAQMGVQFLFAALLAIPFQARFGELTAFQRHAYASTLVLTTLAAVLLIAPASFHRVVFRRRAKEQLVDAAQRLMVAGLGAMALAVLSALVLVLDVVVGAGAFMWCVLGGAVLALLVLWYAWPLAVRRRSEIVLLHEDPD
ncbi:hypothetical protein EV189_3142 [Motilibacter rhizosphaerae]|uniref:Sodium:proton antiporter n=1 Tax=Motilibacter rhizosphaerae TaxID=598652 RepID=A0A4Q7NFQ6_9ACTN|nr:DUF6328 family protein [Motilibacter rhizosphaerae]RZS82747.1 hypothetical protein EV189_3142 [Motilibacter rhizosphaerae]